MYGTLTERVANRRLRGALIVFVALLFFMRVMSANIAAQAPSIQGKAEREIHDKIPKHVPIKVKIKSDKEKGFRDLKNPSWLRDLEIEVTNLSEKPIYFLELWVVMPEIISANGHEVGFTLRYGRIEFVHFDTLPLPTDTPIQPGATYTFTIAENYQKAWETHRANENRQDPTKVEFTFVQLSFGDGTGFNGTDAKPYPYQKNTSSPGSSCIDPGSGIKNTLWDRGKIPITEVSSTPMYSLIPAAFLPVNFSPVETAHATSNVNWISTTINRDELISSAISSGIEPK